MNETKFKQQQLKFKWVFLSETDYFSFFKNYFLCTTWDFKTSERINVLWASSSKIMFSNYLLAMDGNLIPCRFSKKTLCFLLIIFQPLLPLGPVWNVCVLFLDSSYSLSLSLFAILFLLWLYIFTQSGFCLDLGNFRKHSYILLF